jgi:hypothetical protein
MVATSPLSQGRGLKLTLDIGVNGVSVVAPYVGAWIETAGGIGVCFDFDESLLT